MTFKVKQVSKGKRVGSVAVVLRAKLVHALHVAKPTTSKHRRMTKKLLHSENEGTPSHFAIDFSAFLRILSNVNTRGRIIYATYFRNATYMPHICGIF